MESKHVIRSAGIVSGFTSLSRLLALAHRDYRLPGDVQVHVFADRVEINNPGGLVGGMTLDKLGSCSLPRNPLIFGMMHRMGLVEKIGSGILRMRDLCLDADVIPPEVHADREWYSITFRRTSGEPGKTPGKTPERIATLLRDNPTLNIPEIAQQIGRSESAVQRAMRKLQQEGRLIRVGSRKQGLWKVRDAQ